ncbi:MAG TPA: hypothetical protein VE888_21760 [Streptosporangiaceae bacterium]|nr:hypothetical protein [Streptosporangiaceae bacterium]
MLDRLGAEVGQLGVALGQDHAERAQAAHRQEPAGRRHVRGGSATQHAEQEAGRHEQQLEHRDLLQLPRVAEGQAQVGGHRRGEQRLRDEQARGQPGQGTERAEHDRVPLGQLAGGHRPVPLARMQAVMLGVGHVVDEVHRDRGEAEGRRGHQGVEQPVAPAERRAGQRRGENQQVFRPLPRPRGAQHGHRPAGAAGRRGQDRLGGARFGGHRE